MDEPACLETLRQDGSPAALVAYHARHKLEFMAHRPLSAAALGRLVSGAGLAPRECLERYLNDAAGCFAFPVTPGALANALQHGFGMVHEQTTPTERQEAQKLTEAVRQGASPASALAQLRAWAERADAPEWLRTQTLLTGACRHG
ncbi:MAG: DUF1722 domain-containing protein [Candidatus Thermoplasmatota archaeon]